MSNFVIALLVSLGVGGWVYNLTMKHSGSQTKTSLTVAGVVSLLVFLIVFAAAKVIE